MEQEDFAKKKINYDINFDFDEEEEPQTSISYISIIAVLVAIAGFCGLSWYAYTSFKNIDNLEQVPIITNEKAPYKITAENDAHTTKDIDKEYFSNFDKHEEQGTTKIILNNEEPVNKDEILSKTNPSLENKDLNAVTNEKQEPGLENKNLPSKEANNNGTAKISDEFAAELEKEFNDLNAGGALADNSQALVKSDPSQIVAPKEVAGQNNSQPSTEKAQMIEQKNSGPKVAVITSKISDSAPKGHSNKSVKLASKKSLTAKSQKKLAMQNVAKKNPSSSIVYHESFRVQLASFKNKSDAISFWEKTKTNNPGAIGGLEHYIEQRDMGNKGIFYRLQIGAFVNYANAHNLCNKLKDRDIDCLVVKS